jgi:hypothetical protein
MAMLLTIDILGKWNWWRWKLALEVGVGSWRWKSWKRPRLKNSRQMSSLRPPLNDNDEKLQLKVRPRSRCKKNHLGIAQKKKVLSSIKFDALMMMREMIDKALQNIIIACQPSSL